MVTTEKDAHPCTLVNVFQVTPGNQRTVVDELIKVTETTMRRQPHLAAAPVESYNPSLCEVLGLGEEHA